MNRMMDIIGFGDWCFGADRAFVCPDGGTVI